MFRRIFPALACLVGLAGNALPLRADPLSKKTEIDFFRDVPSRNLKGLAARSDGRLVAGPTLTDLAGAAPADLLWCLAPGATPDQWLVGTGPDGRLFEVTIDAAKSAFTSREVAKLDESHIFAIARLPDGALLVGTSPKGTLCLVRDGKVVSRLSLPVDSIFDLLLLPADSNPKPKTQDPKPPAPQAPVALVATGNPGRIYRVDLAQFAATPGGPEKITDAKLLADRGVTLFGEIRDRNVRRIVRLADGRIAAGSSPKGNVYAFPAPTANNGGAVPSPRNAAAAKPEPPHATSLSSAAPPPTPTAPSAGLSADLSAVDSAKAEATPIILQENRDAEVTDLLPAADGGLHVALTFSGGSGEGRITPPKTAAKDNPDAISLLPFANDKFGGRSSLVWIPAHGFPEVLTSRSGTAFYRLARQGDVLVLAGGEQGELLGYDLPQRLSLTFAGSVSSQLNGLAPVPGQPGRFLVLRNNAPGFALLDFAGTAPREAETRRLDLVVPSLLGALHFNRLRGLTDDQLAIDLRISNGSDEIEGWSPWTTLKSTDGAWKADALRGRYVKLRLKLPAGLSGNVQLDKASLYALPQNRRPQLQDFHLLSTNFGLVPAPEPNPPTVVSLGQVLQGGVKDDDTKIKSSFLSSQLVPSPGSQVVLWSVNDPDGDSLLCTFSLRRDGEDAWTDLVRNTRDSYAQFNVSHLPDGTYFTRLVVTETDPRPAADRLSTTFETDDLVVDHTPPEIITASARRTADQLIVTVHGRDALSLLDGLEAVFNNNVRVQTEHPADGVRDSRDETFTLELPADRLSDATSVELTLYDAVGNTASKRLTW